MSYQRAPLRLAACLLALIAAGSVPLAAQDAPSQDRDNSGANTIEIPANPPATEPAPAPGGKPDGAPGATAEDKGATAPDANPDAKPDAKEGPQAPGLRERYRSARQGYKGDPGLMGLNFPHTPQEATEVLGKLFAALSTMEDPDLSLKVMATIERIWRLPGGDTVNLLVDRAQKAADQNKADLALRLLDAAVDLAPDYAEAFNRRAYVHYMKGDTERALGDLRRVLALEPNHFKALEGLAKILSEQGQKKGALKALETLHRINPNTPGAKTSIENLKKEVEGQGI